MLISILINLRCRFRTPVFLLVLLIPMTVGGEAEAQEPILFEGFDDGLPASWINSNPTGEPRWGDPSPDLLAIAQTWVHFHESFAAVEWLDGDPDADSSLQSQFYDMSYLEDVVLEFASSFEGTTGLSTGRLFIGNATAGWTEVLTLDSAQYDGLRSIDVSSWADRQANIQLRWEFESAGESDAAYWAIDEISATGTCVDPQTHERPVRTINNPSRHGIDEDESYVLCVGPPSYPAYLESVWTSLYSLIGGDGTFEYVIYHTPSLSSRPRDPVYISDALTLLECGEDCALDLTGEPVFETPITEGLWCLGVHVLDGFAITIDFNRYAAPAIFWYQDGPGTSWYEIGRAPGDSLPVMGLNIRGCGPPRTTTTTTTTVPTSSTSSTTTTTIPNDPAPIISDYHLEPTVMSSSENCPWGLCSFDVIFDICDEGGDFLTGYCFIQSFDIWGISDSYEPILDGTVSTDDCGDPYGPVTVHVEWQFDLDDFIPGPGEYPLEIRTKCQDDAWPFHFSAERTAYIDFTYDVIPTTTTTTTSTSTTTTHATSTSTLPSTTTSTTSPTTTSTTTTAPTSTSTTTTSPTSSSTSTTSTTTSSTVASTTTTTSPTTSTTSTTAPGSTSTTTSTVISSTTSTTWNSGDDDESESEDSREQEENGNGICG